MAKTTKKPAAAKSNGTATAEPTTERKRVRVRNKKLILTQPVLPGVEYIKVRLNPRTIVMLKSMKTFASWKERYPAAEVIQ